MADVTATGDILSVNVTATPNTISVTDTLSNIAVSNISSQTVNVAVTSNETSVNVTPLAVIANSSIRPAISVTTTGGSLGSLAYNVFTGVINLNGPFASDVRAQLSGTTPVTFNSSTGAIGIDTSALFTGKTTDDLAEGSSNFYYTDSRFNTSFASKTTDNLPQGSTNKYFTTALANTSIDHYTGAFANANINTNKYIKGRLLTNVGGALLLRAENNSGTTIPKGRVVYISNASGTGALSDQPQIFLADNDNASAMPAIGLTFEDIAAGTYGNVCLQGAVTGLNTSGNAAASVMYVSTVAGILTKTKPAGESQKIQPVGIVTRNSATEGAIFVQGPATFNDTPNLNSGNIFIGSSGNTVETKNLNTLIDARTSPTTVITAKNSSGGTISFGQIVHVSGYSASDDAPTIVKADASAGSTMPAIGVVSDASISDGSTGNVRVSGTLSIGSAYSAIAAGVSAGDRLFVSTSAGNPTATNPGPSGNFAQAYAVVTKKTGSDQLTIEIMSTVNLDSTDKLQEGSTNLYYTDGRFDTRLATKSTSDLSEGSNQYFTTARARSSISATSPLSYNSSTGVLSITEAGDISEVIAGTGLTGGGSTGAVTLNVAAGLGITANPDNVAVNMGAFSTSNLSEGTNLYYTNARADARVDAKLVGNNSGQFNQIKVFDLRIKDGPAGNDLYRFGANSASNNQFLVYDGTQFKPTTPTTSIVNEGTNQYFTNARANSAIDNYQGNISTAGTVTAKLDSGKIYIGNPSNTSTTVTPSNNFDTSESSSVNTTVAITLIQAKDNNSANSPPADMVKLTGGQIIADGTLITINSVTNGNATGLNGNSYYAFYFDGPGTDDGYGLYTNADKTGNVAVVSAYNTSGLGQATFSTTSTVAKFDLANAITDLNSITSESANDKFTFKALLGGAATVTDTGNITSDGYEVILDGSATYDSTGNIAQKSSGTNNLNGFAASGAFVKGSTVFSLTGVTQLKNVASGGNIDGTNNNTGLTSSMVANMIPDNFKTLGGDQYPLPPGTVLSSANTSALVFSQAAVAALTFANTNPIAIVHGGKDAATGQIVGFLSQDDALADGSLVKTLAAGGAGGMIKLSDAGESPGTGETSDSLLMGMSPAVSIPVGTGVTFAGVTGTGASNLNGQTLFIRRDVFGDNGNYTLTTDSGGATAATQTAFGTASFNTGGGNITYTTPQSTSTINKARFYVKDAYGYPKVGPKAEDFTYTIGSASNYTIDLSAATKQTRGRTSLEAPKMAFKAPEGLLIGDNATMSNRGDGDTFTNFGLNFVWDGLTNYGNEYIGSSATSLVPQMLFKNYTDNTFASTSSGIGRGGPRLFFSSNNGNINTSEFDKYPRKSQEIGRMMFWGPTQDVGDSMSTVNPSGFISATAAEDWTSSNKLEMSFAANGNGFNNADVFLNYRNGQVVLGSSTNGTAQQPIHFAPAVTTTTGNAAQTYATLGHTWANINYANVSAVQGSKFTVTQGDTLGANSGDLIIALDREFIAGTATQNLATQADGGFTTLSDQGQSPTGNETTATIVITNTGGLLPLGALSVGTAITFTGVAGAGSGSVNGVTFYIGRQLFGAGMYVLFKSADGTTTPATTTDIAIVQPAPFGATGTGGGSYSYTITGTAAKDYSLALETGSDQLKIKSGSTAKITIDDNFTEFGDRIRLKTLTTAQVNALASPAAGDMVFNTTLNLIVVYNGSGWRKINDAAM